VVKVCLCWELVSWSTFKRKVQTSRFVIPLGGLRCHPQDSLDGCNMCISKLCAWWGLIKHTARWSIVTALYRFEHSITASSRMNRCQVRCAGFGCMCDRSITNELRTWLHDSRSILTFTLRSSIEQNANRPQRRGMGENITTQHALTEGIERRDYTDNVVN
jgi:hypothetical protein